jgi:hypothetical protein
MNVSPANAGNGRISWTTLISTGSFVLAVTAGGYSIIQGQINTVKELTAADRQAIRRQLDENDKITSELRATKVDNERFNAAARQLITKGDIEHRDELLQKQIDILNGRVNDMRQALDSTYSLINEHLRQPHPGRSQQ